MTLLILQQVVLKPCQEKSNYEFWVDYRRTSSQNIGWGYGDNNKLSSGTMVIRGSRGRPGAVEERKNE